MFSLTSSFVSCFRTRCFSGSSACQWLDMSHVQSSLGNGRYHYNVSGSRLEVHVRKGYDDGLYISSVASAEGLWAVIMDAGTRFCQQCYHIAPASFLPKAWIMDKWDLGFYITAIAGAHACGFPANNCSPAYLAK